MRCSPPSPGDALEASGRRLVVAGDFNLASAAQVSRRVLKNYDVGDDDEDDNDDDDDDDCDDDEEDEDEDVRRAGVAESNRKL